MMPYILYHKTQEKARGAAEIIMAAGVVALAGAAIASACMLIGAGERQYAPRVMADAPERAEIAETVAAEVIHGAPYTTEYDYSLETEPTQEQVEKIEEFAETEETPETSAGVTLVAEPEPETSAGVVFSVEPEEDGPRVEPPASTAVDAPAEAGPAIPKGSSDAPVGAWTDVDEAYARMIAQVLWGECRGCSVTEQAAVVWCVLNRADSPERYFPDDVAAVIVQPYQFLGYAADNPVTDELYKVARDVLSRWYAERAGAADVGRVLPRGYCFFWGDGRHNYFTTEWRGDDVWDWSLGNPYGDG